ncbi:hypothetical protein ACU7AI_26710, partial [Pseudomonas aeruginosa]
MRTFTWSYLLMLLCAASAAQAQSVVPLKGQSSQQMQLDINDCNTVATNAANGTATSSDPHVGGRVRGAAAGAAAGAVGAQVRGNQHDALYDRVGDDAKQQYRQNRAGEV